MHCAICDKELSDKEVVFNDDIQTYEPCSECLDIIYEAAYGSGFEPEVEFIPFIEDDEEVNLAVGVYHDN